MSNELKYEDSPYLRQHADNPVNWTAWNEKSFEKAEREGKLIFLSIGYSTCHWCHVMEKESFENEEVASILNKYFVSIKADREEMPDVDKYYQDIHYLVNQRGGGWPLSVILLPDRKVIFIATYIPRENQGGFLGFKELLLRLNNSYRENNQKLLKAGKSIEEAYEKYKNFRKLTTKKDNEIIKKFVQNIKNDFDFVNKGMGTAPKFPQANVLSTLLKIYLLNKNPDALQMAKETLHALRKGGINDQIEGGFYRYSTDEAWMIPHFEKMLYTNAELLSAYALLYETENEEETKKVIEETIKAMKERFLFDGLYFCASDADSDGEEGKYFVFKFEEARNILSENGFSVKEVNAVLNYFNITESGNFENSANNPYLLSDEKPEHCEKAKEALKKLRQNVPFPFIDKKILTSWNALFISSLFDVGEKVNPSYIEDARQTLNKLLETLYKDGKLYHQILPGSILKKEALLEDFAFLSEALLKAYRLTGNEKYLDKAEDFLKTAEEKFYRNERWYLGEFKAQASPEDNAYKSPLASVISAKIEIALYRGNQEMFAVAEKMFNEDSANLEDYPQAYPSAVFTGIQIREKQTLLKIPKTEYENSLPEIKKMKNPLILTVKTDEEIFSGCEIYACFAYGKKLNVVLEEVTKRYNNKLK
ncbi:MAG: thioredoxin domain-containing protein [Candidatus Cloacimonadota bacterium]|nr:MAG: thioredoxin domain-containing protein [Candidatus Cloacimonadota bacterium]